MALGEEARLVASDDALKETGRNLGQKREKNGERRVPDMFQADSR